MKEGEDAKKRNFTEGLLVRDLDDGAIASGQVGDEDVVLVRRGDEFFAVGASCSHYHGELSAHPAQPSDVNGGIAQIIES